jgi:hypothetical protein
MRALSYIILLSSQAVLLVGCPKTDPTTNASDSAPSSTPAVSVSQVTLAPLDSSLPAMTATVTAMTATAALTVVAPRGDAAAKPITTGSAATTASPSTQAQFKQCCAALHKQSQQPTAQAAQLAQAAGICDGLVATMSSAPTVPQLDQVKMLLSGVQLPPVCQGL